MIFQPISRDDHSRIRNRQLTKIHQFESFTSQLRVQKFHIVFHLRHRWIGIARIEIFSDFDAFVTRRCEETFDRDRFGHVLSK